MTTSYIQLAQSNNISRKCFNARIKSGMPELEAATKPVMTKQEIGKNNKSVWQKSMGGLFRKNVNDYI